MRKLIITILCTNLILKATCQEVELYLENDDGIIEEEENPSIQVIQQNE